MAAKKNIKCWEASKCGHELGGVKTALKGVCPAAMPDVLRPCWEVAGTYCNESVQDTHGKKKAECLRCDYYQNHGPHGAESDRQISERIRGLLEDYFKHPTRT